MLVCQLHTDSLLTAIITIKVLIKYCVALAKIHVSILLKTLDELKYDRRSLVGKNSTKAYTIHVHPYSNANCNNNAKCNKTI